MTQYLGLDCSTQSLTAVVIDTADCRVVAANSVLYDRDLPRWQTTNGQLPHPDPKVGVAPPLVWLDALDLLLAKLSDNGDLSGVRAVAFSGQQHGSVYLNQRASKALEHLDSRQDLAAQIGPALARDVAPIWTDSSTAEECAEIREALGGAEAAAELTGSDVFERFTGPQIRRFAKSDPTSWQNTDSVALVSSFVTSVLAGKIAPIDQGDASGMNLMNIRTRQWSERALEATWPGLGRLLPEVVACDHVVAPVSSYFSRYGLTDCQVVVGCGDNPSSLIGTGAIEAGDLVISLGTSDTLFGLMTNFQREPSGQGHVFVAPTGDLMTLLCFRNGSLAREAVRDAYGLDWEGFDRAVLETPPGNGGRGMVPWFEPEIVPRTEGPGAIGPHRFGDLDPNNVAASCRAVVEGQALAMRLHSRWMPTDPARIRMTGGASQNTTILQVFADVFGCPVEVAESTDSAALGAALRAANACSGEPSWPSTVAEFAVSRSRIEPRGQFEADYRDLLQQYESAQAVG